MHIQSESSPSTEVQEDEYVPETPPLALQIDNDDHISETFPHNQGDSPSPRTPSLNRV